MSADRPPGRPRSEATRQAILAAALEELEARGYAKLTIEGIARQAGAGKQTIYRWWQSKADLVLDALLDRAASRIPVPDERSLSADLTAFLRSTFRERGQRPVLIGLMAESVFDPAFADAFRERFVFGRRAVLRAILERAVYRGEISSEEDLELLIDVAFGVLWYRLLVDHSELSDPAADQLALLITRAVRSDS
jgi:AcrR family transcriptional regulator